MNQPEKREDKVKNKNIAWKRKEDKMKGKNTVLIGLTAALLLSAFTACSRRNHYENVLESKQESESIAEILEVNGNITGRGAFDYETPISQVPFVDVHANDCEGIEQQLSSEMKTAYCKYTCEKNYGGKSRFQPSDMFILRYEGKIGECHIVMMGGDEIFYTAAIRSVEIAGYRLIFGNGQPVYAYRDGNFYTIKEAYEAGLLSKENVYEIGSIFHPEFISNNPVT